MTKRAIVQIAGVVLLGFNVAIPMYLNAQGMAPGWPWQHHAIIAFIAYTIWFCRILWEKQQHIGKLECGRPQLTLGRTVSVRRELDEKASEIKLELNLFFRNIGTKPAYRFHIRAGYAPDSDVNKFELLDGLTSTNRIDPNNDFEIGQALSSAVRYTEKDGRRIVSPISTLIHCMVSYSDSPSNGKSYKEEWWFSYRADKKHLGMMTEEQRNSLEPYVRSAHGE